MNSEIVIRNETHDDVGAISEVTLRAFKTLEISSHTEQFFIEALRAANALKECYAETYEIMANKQEWGPESS